MNQEFESLPFAADPGMTGEMESERSRWSSRPMRAAGGRRPAPLRAMPRPQPVRSARPRRRPPFFGPYYGSGWPYGVALPEPFPYPEPGLGVEPDADAVQDGFEEQGETPATLGDTLARLPAAQRPAYQALGPIAGAVRDARASGPGLYLIEFTSNGRQRAYSGQTGDLRRRLQQHILCGQIMGLSLAGHTVYIAPLPALNQTQRRALEQRIHRDMFARRAGVLTNQREELELELLGREWV